jgi:hypothetical protein
MLYPDDVICSLRSKHVRFALFERMAYLPWIYHVLLHVPAMHPGVVSVSHY